MVKVEYIVWQAYRSSEVMHACELKSGPGTSKWCHYLLVDFVVFLTMFWETSYLFYICYFFLLS